MFQRLRSNPVANSQAGVRLLEVAFAALLLTASRSTLVAAETPAVPIPAGLTNYVQLKDDSFKWELRSRTPIDGGMVYDLRLISQIWQGITWEHQLQVYQPAGTKPSATLLLWNQGGTAGDKNIAFGLDLARRSNSPCAFLYGIPNQPLLGDKTEDTLIAETFVRYLETKDERWPLLFPMVKSLVKAMDGLQEFSKQEWKQPLTGFVVTGGSKRGWTTWLTAAADPRVKGIVPMVIDTLNMRAQTPYQLKSFGHYSEQIRDYTARGLVPMPDNEDARHLWRMVDPWIYRDRLTLPKLLINGANDPYWTTDATNLYWDDLKGEKWLLYVPNAAHNLEQHLEGGQRSRDRAVNTLAAFARHTVTNKPLPTLKWTHDDADGKARLIIHADTAPIAARFWVAQASNRDFRKAQWSEEECAVAGPAGAGGIDVEKVVSLPSEGCTAFFGELDYKIDDIRYHLSTQMRILEAAK